MKILLLLIGIAFYQNSLGMICVNSASNYIIFGSTARGGVLDTPFVLAFKDEHFNDYTIYHSKDYSEFESQIQSMSEDQCSVILGLFSSKDCLIAGPILKKNKTIGISSACVSQDITNFSPYLYTGTPTYGDYPQRIANKINQTKDTGEIVAFFQPTDIHSVALYNTIKKYITKPIKTIEVSSNGEIELSEIQGLNKQSKTFIFFTYALPSAQILIELDSKKLINHNTWIIADSSWDLELSVLRPIKSILMKPSRITVLSVVNRTQARTSLFYKQFTKEEKRPPDAIEILSYDMARFATQCYKKVTTTSPFNNKDFLDCLSHTQYQGVSSTIHFSKDTPFATRNAQIINLQDWL